MVVGKHKGNGFELDCAHKLSQWLTGDPKDKHQLIRSMGSGGQALKHLDTAEPWAHVGDLAPNGPAGRRFRQLFGVECKRPATIDWWLEFTSRNQSSWLKEWWEKITAECAPHHLVPLLFVKANNKPVLIGYPSTVFPHDMFAGPAFTLEHLEVTFVLESSFLLHTPETIYANIYLPYDEDPR